MDALILFLSSAYVLKFSSLALHTSLTFLDSHLVLQFYKVHLNYKHVPWKEVVNCTPTIPITEQNMGADYSLSSNPNFAKGYFLIAF